MAEWVTRGLSQGTVAVARPRGVRGNPDVSARSMSAGGGGVPLDLQADDLGHHRLGVRPPAAATLARRA